MSSNWKDILRAQNEEMGRLEEMDAALNDDKISADIDRLLKRQPSITVSTSRNKKVSSSEILDGYFDVAPLDDEMGTLHGESESFHGRDEEDTENNQPLSARSSTSRAQKSSARNTPRSPSGGSTQLAPDTAARFQLARNKMLAKQVEDGIELRKQLSEQNADLQKQLKQEREENRKLTKRVQLLEADNKRSQNKRAGEPNCVAEVDTLNQEISALKKDLQTAERIAKQAEASSKAKDVQIKRAGETLSRLKSQLAEIQQQPQGGSVDDKTRADVAEARLRTLERQRTDLISAFKKQMKLIDVLKRQKVHIEAARLLSFTEEEFMKALDWSI